MSLQALVVRGVKWQAAEVAGRQFFSFAVFALLARRLAPADFGLMGFVTVYLTILSLIIDQGVATALVQRKELEESHLNAAFWYNIVCALFMMLATFFVAPLFAWSVNESRLVILLRVSSVTLLTGALAVVQNAILSRTMDFHRIAMRNFFGSILGGLGGLMMVMNGYGVWSLVGQQMIASLAGAVITWQLTDWRPSFCFSLPALKDIFATSTGVFVSNILWQISLRLDQLTVGYAFGSAVLGQYVVGKKLVDFLNGMISAPIGAVALPALSRVQSDHDQLRTAVIRGVALISTGIFPVFAGLAVVSRHLIPLLYGDHWDMAGSYCALMALYTLASSAGVLIHPTLIATGGVGLYVWVSLANALGVVIACTVGVFLGPMSLLWGLLINLLVINYLALRFMQTRIPLSPTGFCSPMAAPAVACAVMGLAVLLVQSSPLATWPAVPFLIVQILTGCLAYVAAMSVIAPSRITGLLRLIIAPRRHQPADPVAEPT